MSRASIGKFSDEQVINILDRVFGFALEVIEAKGKNADAT
jgi:hypothetical protein